MTNQAARYEYIQKLRQMSDDDLFELERETIGNHDHPYYDEIMEEADYRQAINSDSRVAQAMGES